MAIPLFQLGRTLDAEEALGQADETLEEWTVAIAQSPLPSMPIDWKDWLEFRIYLREARMLIRQQELESDQRLADREQAALRHLTGADANGAPVNHTEPVADQPTPPAAAQTNPTVPRFWTNDEMKSVELPLARSMATPSHITEEYYYQIPEMKLHRSYPVYHPDEEPPGYFEKLLTTAPEIIWDSEQHPTLGIGSRLGCSRRADFRNAHWLWLRAYASFDGNESLRAGRKMVCG